MALPKIDVPVFVTRLPASDIEISLRPFSVKEEKILLMADEAKNTDDVLEAIKQVVNNCILGSANVNHLPVIDIQYIFIQLRARSVGNIAEIMLTDPDDKKKYKVEVDLDKIEIIRPEKLSNVVMLNDEIGITLRYPTIEIARVENPTTADLLINCMVNIFDQEQVYEVADQTQEELMEFIGSLTTQHVTKMKEFFASAPKIKCDIQYTTEDGVEKTLEVSNLQDFFR